MVALLPAEFLEIASHLIGVDELVSLGKLRDIQPVRRRRDDPLDPEKVPYLMPLTKYPDAKWIDLFCPGYLYESTHPSSLEFSRSQLFAMAAGVSNVANARPHWNFKHGVSVDERPRRRIGVQFRATCAARCLPFDKCTDVLKELIDQKYEVYYYDCVLPGFRVPDGVELGVGKTVPQVAESVFQCDLVLTVDSFLFHLAAAVNTPAIGIFGPTDGGAADASYTEHSTLEGHGTKCPIACNYNTAKGWNKICRTTGCERMLSITVDEITEAVQRHFALVDSEL